MVYLKRLQKGPKKILNSVLMCFKIGRELRVRLDKQIEIIVYQQTSTTTTSTQLLMQKQSTQRKNETKKIALRSVEERKIFKKIFGKY